MSNTQHESEITEILEEKDTLNSLFKKVQKVNNTLIKAQEDIIKDQAKEIERLKVFEQRLEQGVFMSQYSYEHETEYYPKGCNFPIKIGFNGYKSDHPVTGEITYQADDIVCLGVGEGFSECEEIKKAAQEYLEGE